MDPLPEPDSGPEQFARHRRHAWLLATLTELIGDCARTAGAVYRPAAEAGPAQPDVPADRTLFAGLLRSARARVDAARAQDAVRCVAFGRTVTRCAAAALADAGADFLADLLDHPAQAVRRAQELAGEGGFTLDQILDEATDSAVLSGLLSLHEAQRESDPGTAAAKCLAAAGHFALAVSVVSVDVPARP
ncbi:hypothetical protein [Streptomyces sp. NPDC091217]|uniref:hypothetical protein n=1 Tax=Streptomyces sp. NPDC091217 TaxID=3365975 RepID=UPI003829DB8B